MFETVPRTGMFTIVQNDFDSALGLVNYTVWKFRPLIMKIFKTVFVKLRTTKHTCLFISNRRVLSESAFLGSHFTANLQQTHF